MTFNRIAFLSMEIVWISMLMEGSVLADFFLMYNSVGKSVQDLFGYEEKWHF